MSVKNEKLARQQGRIASTEAEIETIKKEANERSGELHRRMRRIVENQSGKDQKRSRITMLEGLAIFILALSLNKICQWQGMNYSPEFGLVQQLLVTYGVFKYIYGRYIK